MQTSITGKFFNQSVGFCKVLMAKIYMELAISRYKSCYFLFPAVHFVPSPYWLIYERLCAWGCASSGRIFRIIQYGG